MRCACEEAEPRKGMYMRRCASKDAGLRRRWIKGPLEEGTNASEDAGPQKGWIVRFHVGWRGE